MIGFSRWCMRHRRWVVIAWLVIAVGSQVIASAVGRNYSTNFTLPGTQSQRVADLLTNEFKSQSGDVDTIVFRYTKGRYDAPAVKTAIEGLLAKVAKDPAVVSVSSPYTAEGSKVQVSKDGQIAFATINYSKRANLLPDNTGKPVLHQMAQVHVPGLKLAAGGQVIEQAEGFNIGPATIVGVLAAMVILLITFGSLVAAGLPLITAGFGLITGTALIGLATHFTSMSNVAPELALMIGLGVGVDYALFIVTRFREAYHRVGDVEAAVIEAMDTSGRAILLAGCTVIIALLGMFATGVSFMYGLSIASVMTVLLVLLASLTVVPALLSRFGDRVVRPTRGERRRERAGRAPSDTAWRRWSVMVQARPVLLTVLSLAIMVACLIPFLSLRLQSSDAGNDPAGTSSYTAFNLLSQGFGPGFNGPLLVAVEMPHGTDQSALAAGARGDDPHLRRDCRDAPAALPVRQGRGDGGLSALGAAGAGDHEPGQQAQAGGLPAAQPEARGGGVDRRLHGRLDRLLACALGQAAAVHRDRRGALGAAVAGDLPLDRDPDPSGGDEPAQHRRRARRDRGRVPVGLVRRASSASRAARSSRGSRC